MRDRETERETARDRERDRERECQRVSETDRQIKDSQQNSLLASAVSLAAGQRHLHHAGGEGHPQRVAHAVYLDADDALVFHAVHTASADRGWRMRMRRDGEGGRVMDERLLNKRR